MGTIAEMVAPRHSTPEPETPTAAEPRNLLREFKSTPPNTCTASLQWAILHWNIPVNPSACCNWHYNIDIAIRLLTLRKASPCRPTWSPLDDWQCERCLSMNHSVVEVCDVCRQHRTTRASSPASPSSSFSADYLRHASL